MFWRANGNWNGCALATRKLSRELDKSPNPDSDRFLRRATWSWQALSLDKNHFVV